MPDLSGFTGQGYSKGRHVGWQVAWLTCQSVFMRRWWFPARGRALVLRWFGAQLGTGVLVRDGVTIHWPWKLAIGDATWIGSGAWILNLERVTIGSNCCISQDALICTGSHDRHSPTFEFDNAPIDIGDDAWIAARAVVLRGVTIGRGAVIGANVVVSRDVPAGAMLVPPRPIERTIARTDGADDRTGDRDDAR